MVITPGKKPEARRFYSLHRFLVSILRALCRHPASALYGNEEGIHCAKCRRQISPYPLADQDDSWFRDEQEE